jgi:DNA sulfur modification protein DndE
MKPPVETVRLSDRSKDILTKLKRSTGIQTWNVLSRVAFSLSVRDKSVPPPATEGERPSIEMAWKIFAGENADLVGALLRLRFARDRQSGFSGSVEECLKRHIFRGLGSLDAATNSRNKGSLQSVFSEKALLAAARGQSRR